MTATDAKVYLLYDGEYEQRYVAGVYGSLHAAQDAHMGSHDGQWERNESGWSCAFRMVPIEVSIPDVTFKTGQVRVVDGKATLPDGRIVESTGQYVVYPIMPERPVMAYTGQTYCSMDIEEHSVR